MDKISFGPGGSSFQVEVHPSQLCEMDFVHPLCLSPLGESFSSMKIRSKTADNLDLQRLLNSTIRRSMLLRSWADMLT